MKKKSIQFLFFVFVIFVVYLLYERLKVINFQEVKNGLEELSLEKIYISLFLVAINYIILGTYDYLAIRTQKINPPLRYKRTLLSAFVCYAFTLNLGALVGGLGFRYRIYSGWGIHSKDIPRIILFSVLANWSGYLLLLGFLILTQLENLKRAFQFPVVGGITIGVVSLVTVLSYLYLCYRGGIKFKFKNTIMTLPRFPVALLQLLLSSVQWALLGSIINIFLEGLGIDLSYSQVLFTLLLSGIAGVITHIPAGLGVTETVFLALIQDVDPSSIIVALVCFRAVYYFVPLFVALPSYILVEIYQKKKSLSTS